MDTNQLQLENEKLNARLEKAKEVFRQQAADIKAKDDAYLKLKDEYDELNKQLLELETQKQSISNMYNKTVTAINMRDDEIEELRKNIAKFEEGNSKYDELNKQLLDLETQKQSICVMYDKTVTALKMRDDEIEELRKTIAKFEEGNSKYDGLQEELNTTKKELHIANETINEYVSKCARYDEVIKSLNEKNEDLDVLATSRLADIKKREEDIVNLNNTIEQMNTEFANITIKYNDTLTDRNELAKSKEAMAKSYKELQDTYNKLAEENTSKVQFLNNVIEQLKEDIEDKDDRLVDALDKVGELQKQLETESGKVEEVKTKTEVAVTSIKKKLQALNDGLGDEFNIFG